MKLFNKAAEKLKGMFVEEIPEKKVEVKKEVYKVEIAAPEEELSKKEEKEVEIKKVEEEIEEEPMVEEKPKKKEENFKFPVYFNDDDLEKIEKDEKEAEEKVRTSFSREDFTRDRNEEKRPSFRDAYGARKEESGRDFASLYKKEEPKKTFKPTPIISPVYGILDKNYSKEDITTKKSTRLSSELTSDRFTIDEVRKKAYGTLEDDIETSLFGELEEEKEQKPTEELFDDIEKENTDNIMADELLNSFDNEFDDSYTKNVLDDEPTPVEETLSRDYDSIDETPKKKTRKTIVEEEPEKDDEDIDMTESDLFNLIDSWYEKRDEE